MFPGVALGQKDSFSLNKDLCTFKTACKGVHVSSKDDTARTETAINHIANTVYTIQFVTRLVQQGIGYLLEFAEKLQLDAEDLVAGPASSQGGAHLGAQVFLQTDRRPL